MQQHLKNLRWKQPQSRKQCNFKIDSEIIVKLKLPAAQLELPLWPISEHCLLLGTLELVDSIQDAEMKISVVNHLIYDHLLSDSLHKDTYWPKKRVEKLQRGETLASWIDHVKVELVDNGANPNVVQQVVIGKLAALRKEIEQEVHSTA